MDDLPILLADAYATCAMYMAKNDVNKLMIFRAIERSVAELIKSPQSTVPIEVLARTQSLLLYQIIRLYDGDIRLRAQGEADIGDLEVYAYLLLGLLDDHGMWPDASLVPPESHHSHHSNSGPPSHATWIFQESCRRTALVSFFFVSFYTMLREASCSHGMMVGARAWTLGAHLWNAPSEFDFKVAWTEKNHYIIRHLDFGEVLPQASPEDIDDFGKAFLVMTQGLDDVRQWYHKQGYKLV